jgi:hypothetical protein
MRRNTKGTPSAALVQELLSRVLADRGSIGFGVNAAVPKHALQRPDLLVWLE